MTRPVAVITGGAGGMGLACARVLGDAHRLLLADVDADRLRAAGAALAGEGFESEGELLDVADRAQMHTLAARAAELGPLGALVHTAGLSPTMADGACIWQVNLNGSAYLMDAFRPSCRDGSVAVLLASQAGHLIRTGATAELEALLDAAGTDDLVTRVRSLDEALLDPGAAYGASKYGVIRLAERESTTWGPSGGRVVSLSPGIVDTAMGRAERAAQPFMQTMIEQTPLGRMGTAAEIATVVAFLCSPAASFLTGTDVLVDGGSTQAVRSLLAGGTL